MREITVDKCVGTGVFDEVDGCPFLDSQGCNIDWELETRSFEEGFPDECPLKKGSITVKIKENKNE